MILVSGGLGFIGSHTVRALLDAGAACVAGRHRSTDVAPFLAGDVGRALAVEPLEVNTWATWAAIFERHPITGIVHLAGSGSPGPLDDLRVSLSPQGTLCMLQAARQWHVRRVVVASSIGVYAGVLEDGPALREDMRLPMVGHHGIETGKKIDELLGSVVARNLGLDVVCARLSGIWGPLGRPRARFFSAPQLVHGAVYPQGPGAGGPAIHADDGGDLLYVKDCAQALALLATRPELPHRLYNVGAGRLVRHAEIAAAIRSVLPEAPLALAAGRSPSAAAPAYLDISRLQADTGYTPAYGIEGGVADYVAWLRSGHDR